MDRTDRYVGPSRRCQCMRMLSISRDRTGYSCRIPLSVVRCVHTLGEYQAYVLAMHIVLLLHDVARFSFNRPFLHFLHMMICNVPAAGTVPICAVCAGTSMCRTWYPRGTWYRSTP